MHRSILLAFLLLAGCGQPARDAAPANAVPAADGYGARVAALPAQQRLGVMLRAIRDAGQDCQGVTDAVAAPGGGGGPRAWVATCDDRRQWVVAIADDGTATVADAQDVARRSPR